MMYRLIEETDGTLSPLQMFSSMSFSRISHANMVGFACLYSVILDTTSGVATLGFEPPITPGFTEPVSSYLIIRYLFYLQIGVS